MGLVSKPSLAKNGRSARTRSNRRNFFARSMMVAFPGASALDVRSEGFCQVHARELSGPCSYTIKLLGESRNNRIPKTTTLHMFTKFELVGMPFPLRISGLRCYPNCPDL